MSVDTVRRWADAGRLGARRTEGGQRVVDGAALAEFMTSHRHLPEHDEVIAQSARNRFQGIVTRVVKDEIVAKVELQAGPYRVVSLMTAEAADELRSRPRDAGRGRRQGDQRGRRAAVAGPRLNPTRGCTIPR